MMNSMSRYRYVLSQSSSFHSRTKPDNEKNVVGTYARCGKKFGIHVDSRKYFSQLKNRLVWFDKSDVELNNRDSNSTDCVGIIFLKCKVLHLLGLVIPPLFGSQTVMGGDANVLPFTITQFDAVIRYVQEPLLIFSST